MDRDKPVDDLAQCLDDWSGVDPALAERIVALGSRVARPVWTRAQQFVLSLLERGEGGAMLDAELVDVEPAQPGPVVLDDDEDFTFRDAEVSGRYGCDGDAYFVEANSGPGWVYSGATNVPRPISP